MSVGRNAQKVEPITRVPLFHLDHANGHKVIDTYYCVFQNNAGSKSEQHKDLQPKCREVPTRVVVRQEETKSAEARWGTAQTN